jgi:23S rRNA (cytosine1962-C5)-methyltransferase
MPQAARPVKREAALPFGPRAVVSIRGASRLKSGHVWIYRSDIASVSEAGQGALVSVYDERGHVLGSALYSTSSQIALRMLSERPVADLAALIRERVRQAIAYREGLVRDTDAYRVVFSEADFLPGLIVDRYNDILSLHILTQAMDRDDVRATLLHELSEIFRPGAITERVEPHIRELEQLPPHDS